MPNRYFRIPLPITVKLGKKKTIVDGKEVDIEVTQVVTCYDLIRNVIDDVQIGETMMGIRLSAKLDLQVEGKPVGSLVKMTGEEHKLFVKIIEAPTGGYTFPIVMRQMVPMIDMMINAPEEPPPEE